MAARTGIVRFASFVSVSSEEQAEGQSLDSQRQDNLDFVDNLAKYYPGETGVVVAEMELVGSRSIVELTDAIAKHPGYAELLRLIRNQQIDAIVCRSRDRLGRKGGLILTIQDICETNRVVIVPRDNIPSSLDPDIVYADESRSLITAVESVLNEAEIRRLQRRRRVGMVARVENGEFPNNIPWGYEYQFTQKGERIIVQTADAKLIRRAFDLYLNQGMSMRMINMLFMEEGQIAPGGGPWKIKTINHIFAIAERYAGYIEWGKGTDRHVIARGNHPPIISEDELHLVRRTMTKRTKGRHKQLNTRPLTGAVFCGVCNQPMGATTRRKRLATGKVALYKIYTCKNLQCSDWPSITEDSIMDAVRATINFVVSQIDPETIEDDESDLVVQSLEIERERIKAEIKGLDGVKDRSIRAYTFLGTLSDADFVKQMDNIRATLANLEEDLLRVEEDIRVRLQQGTRKDRVQEIKDRGDQLLASASKNPRAFNLFMRRHFLIIINPRKSRRDRIEVTIM